MMIEQIKVLGRMSAQDFYYASSVIDRWREKDFLRDSFNSIF
jgi:hypothetical protein